MKKYCGFCPARIGDVAMMTVAARALKTIEPDCHLTFVVSPYCGTSAALYLNHPHIDRVHILHKYNDGFDEVDLEWLKREKFDHIFNPMQDHDHSRPWWRERIQTLESAHMHGLSLPEGDAGKIELAKWFEPNKRFVEYVAFAPFPGFYMGKTNHKSIPLETAQDIVDYIVGKGYGVLQIGGPNEPQISGALKLDTDYFGSVQNILGCKGLICGDSGINWIASGYDFPAIGLYAYDIYGPQFIRNIQPINPNATYLSAQTVGDISLDLIMQHVDNLLEL